jgi:serine/threonine protein phosphatase PrpC
VTIPTAVITTLSGNPNFSGAPTLSASPATADNSTALATTAFVKAQAYAPLASPAFTGTATANILRVQSGTANDISLWSDGHIYLGSLGDTNAYRSVTNSVPRLTTDNYLFAKGPVITSRTSAPADADLAAGELAIWFDKTTGAAKLMVKAKDNGGTVRTGSLALT